MSWVRFSTICENNRYSDIYCYDSSNGVIVMIASMTHSNEENAPKVPLWDDTWKCDDEEEYSEKWHEWWYEFSRCKQIKKQWLKENSEFIPIDLPYAGEEFEINDKEELIKLLTELRDVGYNFPNHVFETAAEWEPE